MRSSIAPVSERNPQAAECRVQLRQRCDPASHLSVVEDREIDSEIRQRCDSVSHLSVNVDGDAIEHRTRHGAHCQVYQFRGSSSVQIRQRCDPASHLSGVEDRDIHS